MVSVKKAAFSWEVAFFACLTRDKTSMNQKIAGAAIAVAIAAGVLLYATPCITLHQIHSAIERKDAAAVAEHVDFPALRASLKAQVLAKMQSEMDNAAMKDNPFAGLGQMLARGLVDQFTEALVSPEGVMLMLENGKPGKPADVAAAGVGIPSGEPEKPRKKLSVEYQGWSKVFVHAQGEPGGFVFQRDGLIGWKLVAAKMD